MSMDEDTAAGFLPNALPVANQDAQENVSKYLSSRLRVCQIFEIYTIYIIIFIVDAV